MKKYISEQMVKISRYRNYFPTLPQNVQQDIYQRMAELMQEKSVYCDKKNDQHMAQILTSIAMYEVLQKHGHSEEETYRIVSEQMWVFLDPSGMQKIARNSFFLPLMKMIVPLGFRIKSGYGWRYTWHKDDPKDSFRFECNECIYAKILGKRGLMKLGAMCCHADIINYGNLPFTDFIRTKTLCQGGLNERCFSGAVQFLKCFHIVIPVLDGNVIGETSTLPERKVEVSRIITGLAERGIGHIKVLHGVSYGAMLALEILVTRKIRSDRTVLDGGSFLKYGFLMRAMNLIGTKSYVTKIRKNPDQPSMYAALGEEIDRCGREVFSQMSDASLKMLITDSMSGVTAVPGGVIEEDHLIVTYGEKDGHKDGLRWFEKSGYPYEKAVIKGYGHCRCFAEKPDEFISRFYMLEMPNS